MNSVEPPRRPNNFSLYKEFPQTHLDRRTKKVPVIDFEARN